MIRYNLLDNVKRERVGREEDGDITSSVFRVGLKGCLDVVRKRLSECKFLSMSRQFTNAHLSVQGEWAIGQ